MSATPSPGTRGRLERLTHILTALDGPQQHVSWSNDLTAVRLVSPLPPSAYIPSPEERAPRLDDRGTSRFTRAVLRAQVHTPPVLGPPPVSVQPLPDTHLPLLNSALPRSEQQLAFAGPRQLHQTGPLPDGAALRAATHLHGGEQAVASGTVNSPTPVFPLAMRDGEGDGRTAFSRALGAVQGTASAAAHPLPASSELLAFFASTFSSDDAALSSSTASAPISEQQPGPASTSRAHACGYSSRVELRAYNQPASPPGGRGPPRPPGRFSEPGVVWDPPLSSSAAPAAARAASAGAVRNLSRRGLAELVQRHQDDEGSADAGGATPAGRRPLVRPLAAAHAPELPPTRPQAPLSPSSQSPQAQRPWRPAGPARRSPIPPPPASPIADTAAPLWRRAESPPRPETRVGGAADGSRATTRSGSPLRGPNYAVDAGVPPVPSRPAALSAIRGFLAGSDNLSGPWQHAPFSAAPLAAPSPQPAKKEQTTLTRSNLPTASSTASPSPKPQRRGRAEAAIAVPPPFLRRRTEAPESNVLPSAPPLRLQSSVAVSNKSQQPSRFSNGTEAESSTSKGTASKQRRAASAGGLYRKAGLTSRNAQSAQLAGSSPERFRLSRDPNESIEQALLAASLFSQLRQQEEERERDQQNVRRLLASCGPFQPIANRPARLSSRISAGKRAALRAIKQPSGSPRQHFADLAQPSTPQSTVRPKTPVRSQFSATRCSVASPGAGTSKATDIVDFVRALAQVLGPGVTDEPRIAPTSQPVQGASSHALRQTSPVPAPYTAGHRVIRKGGESSQVRLSSGAAAAGVKKRVVWR